jgi:prepilin-type processing-associated H-X9-DG protein
MRRFINLIAFTLFAVAVSAKEPVAPPKVNATLRAVRYDALLNDIEARFTVELDLNVRGKCEAVVPLFEGDVAVLTTKLPDGFQLTRDGNRYALLATKEGEQKLKLELLAKITKAEPWNSISFTGPFTVIASVNARAAGNGVEVQLLKGTVSDSAASRVSGFLGAERVVTLRWQSKAAEITRKALLTCDTTLAVQVTPTVVKYITTLRYEILQGNVPRLTIALPAAQALTKLQGDGIRDWQVKNDNGQQTLSVEFLRPVEKTYTLTLFSEQTLDNTAATTVGIAPPQPLEVEREAGSLVVSAEDVLVETDNATGLRQVNAPAGAVAAYQFHARPFALGIKPRRIEPVINATDRVTVRLEETRLSIAHALTLTVEKAGIYALELVPQAGLIVSDVRGEGVEDWKSKDGKIAISFNNRILGRRALEVQMEQPLKSVPEKILVAPLRVTGAAKETAQVGAASAAGIQLKTAADGLVGLREVAVNRLAGRADESLAYNAEQAAWSLTLAAERLAPRVNADVFNLVTVGDGIVGGSATIRYAVFNQGVQEFRVRVPGLWKNVEFTGPNIRRKEQQGDVWVIGLQDKAWGGYTLVVTYDLQFDHSKALLPVGGAHVDGVERETGSLAITSAGNLQIAEGTKSAKKDAGGTIRRVDETELTMADRALITRPVLLAYRYTGGAFELTLNVTRFEELSVLDAVADRTQLTTVLTDAGQLLTQASFMVKNNDKQFQSFTLPAGAAFWSCYVRGEPMKPEKHGDRLLVPLPRGANRDEAFAVDIVYAENVGVLKKLMPQRVSLTAPVTDMQTAYAEWELFAPDTRHLAAFGGNMIVERGTIYDLRDAWRDFYRFYDDLWEKSFGMLVGIAVLFLIIFWIAVAIRRGFASAIFVIVVVAVVGILAAMLFPVFGRVRESAYRVKTASSLKQIGMGVAQYYEDNNEKMPPSLEALSNYVGNTTQLFYDASTGEPITYVGSATKWQAPVEGVIAYGSSRDGGRNVLYTDGHVAWEKDAEFNVALQRGIAAYSDGATREDMVSGGKAGSEVIGVDAGKKKPGWKELRVVLPKPVLVGTPMPIHDVTNLETRSDEGDLRSQRTAGGVIYLGEAESGKGPSVAGLRPIRIEMPKSGTRFAFTKVLNVRSEPLTVSTMVMDKDAFKVTRGLAQAAVFVAGLALFGLQWWRGWRSSFRAALGLALALGGAGALLLSVRVLDVAMILVSMLAAFVVLGWAARKLWKAIPKKVKPVSPVSGGAVPPVVAALIAAALIGAAGAEANPGPKVTFVNASYTGTVQAADAKDLAPVARVEATLELESSEPDQVVRLFGNDVAVEEISGPKSSGGWFDRRTETRMVRDVNGVSVVLPEKGKATVRVKFLVKLGGDAAKRRVEFAIPAALTSKLSVLLDETDAQVEAPTAVSFQATTEAAKTRVEAVIGAGDRVELTWTPRTKRAAEIAATIFCQNTSLVTLGNGVLNTRSTLDYTVTQGELRRLGVVLPAGHRLMRVEGENIRTWKMDGQTVNVELLKGVSPSYRLVVETEKPLETSSVKVETARAVDVKRETGLIGLKTAEELSASVETADGLQKVDIEEFARGNDTKAVVGVSSAYRFLKPEFNLALRAELVHPQIEATVRNAARITTEQVSVSATVDYVIKKAGVFALALSVPDGYRVERVRSLMIATANAPASQQARLPGSDVVAQWVVTPGAKPGEPQRVAVALKQRMIGAFTLQVELTRRLTELPKSVVVAGVQPLDAQKLNGFISVASEEGLQVKTESFDGLTEVPATAVGLAAGGGGLAFKMIPVEEPVETAGWKLTVGTEQMDSWVRAEIVNRVNVTETLVSGVSLVRYDIQNAPTKEFRLKMPAAWKNVEINAPNIRRKDNQNGEWRVELQNKVRGEFTLSVTWERPWNVKDGALETPGVEALGVERETGYVAVLAPSVLKIEPKDVSAELLKIDARELPEWSGGGQPVLVYRYLRPGYRLAMTTQRFEEAEVLQALVDKVNLTTVVSEDGQMMTEMKLAIRNNARQYLEVTLPSGASNVWSAFVAGQPVRPSVRGGKLLVPLERSGADGAPVNVELTYVNAEKFPAHRGTVKFDSPALDVPLKNARWELYLPPDFDYSRFEGSMKHEKAAAGYAGRLGHWQTASAMFSMTDYAAVESRNKRSRTEQAQMAISNSSVQLRDNNLNDAVQNLKIAKNNWDDSDVAQSEYKKLEKQVRKGQGKMLVEAQNSYSYNNGAQQLEVANIDYARTTTISGGFVNAPAQGVNFLQYDEEAAEQQAGKVAKAQEITVVKAMPLRVNLPRRGVHVAFTQVLQTEVSKPMNVEFRAVEAKGISWLWLIALAVAGLGALWFAMRFALSRRTVAA